jgi:hypothetical protein
MKEIFISVLQIIKSVLFHIFLEIKTIIKELRKS